MSPTAIILLKVYLLVILSSVILFVVGLAFFYVLKAISCLGGYLDRLGTRFLDYMDNRCEQG